jgi:hypothetical protein
MGSHVVARCFRRLFGKVGRRARRHTHKVPLVHAHQMRVGIQACGIAAIAIGLPHWCRHIHGSVGLNLAKVSATFARLAELAWPD